jgi:RNA polymerase sigma-70 factor (ECF subfamily)
MPLILKDIVGFSVAEVADVLGLKEATVKTRLHRARLALRETLSRELPTRDAPPPAYPKRVCMDLLRAKQEALDRGVPFPMQKEDFCERCSAVFASMDLAKDVCNDIGRERLPEQLQRAILDDMRADGN